MLFCCKDLRVVTVSPTAPVSPCYLTGVVSGLSPCTEAAGRHDEDLLSHRVDLPHALVVVDDGDPGLSYPERYGSGWKDKCE